MSAVPICSRVTLKVYGTREDLDHVLDRLLLRLIQPPTEVRVSSSSGSLTVAVILPLIGVNLHIPHLTPPTVHRRHPVMNVQPPGFASCTRKSRHAVKGTGGTSRVSRRSVIRPCHPRLRLGLKPVGKLSDCAFNQACPLVQTHGYYRVVPSFDRIVSLD